MFTLTRFVMLFALMGCVLLMMPQSVRAEDKAANPEEKAKDVLVEIQTSMGDITLKLFPDKAPKTVANFLVYVDEGYYAGTIFHRVIPTFMIQAGMGQDMKEKKTHDPIVNEDSNGLSNKLGTVAMARRGSPHSATSQFFINVKDNPNLDKHYDGNPWGYCVFGQVVKGMSVVNEIKNVQTTSKGMHNDVPVKPIIINKVVRVKE